MSLCAKNMKENQIRHKNLSQVAFGKPCIGNVRIHKDQNLGVYPLNLYCIQNNLPVNLHTSQTKGPHLQKQVSKLGFLFYPFCQVQEVFSLVFFKASVKKSN